jgi:hypothetical protein
MSLNSALIQGECVPASIAINLHFSSTCQNRLFGGFFMISKIFSDENA